MHGDQCCLLIVVHCDPVILLATEYENAPLTMRNRQFDSDSRKRDFNLNLKNCHSIDMSYFTLDNTMFSSTENVLINT